MVTFTNMAPNSFKLILVFILVNAFNFTTTKAQDPDPTFIDSSCETSNGTTVNNTDSDLAVISTLLSSLSSNASNKTFFNSTVASKNSTSGTMCGLFMCRGDVPSQLCGQCVANATQRLLSDCSSFAEGVIWYDACMVRYSNISFFSTVDTYPGYWMWNVANVSNPENFTSFLLENMNQTADKAADSHTIRNYATNKILLNVSESQILYSLAQCTRDLSPHACQTCLAQAIGELPTCCEGRQGGRVLFPSCNVRYELYPFYLIQNDTSEGLVPETIYPQKDSKYSEDPGYISHDCSSEDNSNVTTNSTFQSDLNTLLSDLSSNSTSGNKFMMHVGMLHGLYTCRGDISKRLCGQCVQNATQRIVSECHSSMEAIIWYNHCWLRYSNRSFSMETSPRVQKLNLTDPVENSFTFKLSNKLAEIANETGNNEDKYQTGTLKFDEVQTLYIVAQCTKDLSSDECGVCLNHVIGSAIPWSRLGSVGGRILYPSCNLRFELFQFYNLTPPSPFYNLTPPTSPPPPSGKRKRLSRTIVVIASAITVSAILILSFCCYLKRRKPRKNDETILRENFGDESTAIESLRYELAIIEAATNNFSQENKIGKGGFGEVYKGTLISGRAMAIKRLSRSSKQGVEEFKNEVLLISKLQHRNLVALMGFCLDEQEKILIYEYVPNKSLDYFLFDAQLEEVLTWPQRHEIIKGIAQGILYLHQSSRLKIIHRDLKPSNILLNENMNPKISYFGLAKIVEINQEGGSTKKFVGTYGYMSPEYAMLGQFSEKSDVFSFGVMILEIISGKKNVGSYEPNQVANGLLSSVWRHWRDETALDILDPKLKENYSKIDIIKCIQIGLLCVQENPNTRPTMVTIVSYLQSHHIPLPSPEEPAFVLHNRTNPKVVEQESSSGQSTNQSVSSSINGMSITEFYPR